MKPEPPTPKPHEVGAALRAIADARGETLVGLSRLIGKRDGYLQAFVSEGSPRVLPDKVLSLLARYLGVSERELGKAEP